MTEQELKELLIKHNTTYVPVHNCSMCNYPCGYHLCFTNADDRQVFYDSGCDCVNYGPNIQPNSYNDLLQYYSCQTEEKHKESIMGKFTSGAATWHV